MRALTLMASLLVGCDDTIFEAHSSEGGGTDETGYDGAVEIIEASCLTGCHDASGQAGGLDLETDFCGSTVGVPSLAYSGNLIEAGDSASSVLYLKRAGAEGVGGVMPISGALDDASVAVIGDWIDSGAGCESSDTDDTGDTSGGDTGGEADGYSYERVVSEVWPQCTGCHNANGDSSSTAPVLGDDPSNLINQKSNFYGGKTLVIPGDPEASFLYWKVRGILPDGEDLGTVMPPYGNGLSTDDLTLIYGWILELEEE